MEGRPRRLRWGHLGAQGSDNSIDALKILGTLRAIFSGVNLALGFSPFGVLSDKSFVDLSWFSKGASADRHHSASEWKKRIISTIALSMETNLSELNFLNCGLISRSRVGEGCVFYFYESHHVTQQKLSGGLFFSALSP